MQEVSVNWSFQSHTLANLTGILLVGLLLMNIIGVLKELAVQGHSPSSLKNFGSWGRCLITDKTNITNFFQKDRKEVVFKEKKKYKSLLTLICLKSSQYHKTKQRFFLKKKRHKNSCTQTLKSTTGFSFMDPTSNLSVGETSLVNQMESQHHHLS